MGTDGISFEADGEAPIRKVALTEYYMSQHTITNTEFYQFIDETGYTTDAEEHGWSFIFEDHLIDRAQKHAFDMAGSAPWWVAAEGASWYQPFELGSEVKGRLDHPFVHISWNDAVAY